MHQQLCENNVMINDPKKILLGNCLNSRVNGRAVIKKNCFQGCPLFVRVGSITSITIRYRASRKSSLCF